MGDNVRHNINFVEQKTVIIIILKTIICLYYSINGIKASLIAALSSADIFRSYLNFVLILAVPRLHPAQGAPQCR